MNRLWLREYESLLCAGRKEKGKKEIPSKLDTQPVKKKKKRKIKTKKLENEVSENVLAQRLLAAATREDFDRNAAANDAKLAAKTKELSKSKRAPVFNRIQTIEEFEKEEKRKETFMETGGATSYFDTMFPDVSHSLPAELFQSPLKTFNQTTTNGAHRTVTTKTRPSSSPATRSQTAFSPTFGFGFSHQDDSHVDASSSPTHNVPSVFVKKDVAAKAEDIWKVLLDDLWYTGHLIEYADVTYLKSKWTRSECTQFVVQYVCALLGLRTAMSDLPKVAERSVFREILSLVKFFRDMNPLTVPVRRLHKARMIYQNHIENKSAECNSDPQLVKFIEWIIAIQRILDVMSHAHVHRTVLENDAILSEESAVLKHERDMSKRRVLELETIRQTAAAKAAMQTPVKKVTAKSAKRCKSAGNTRAAASVLGTAKWVEHITPLSDTFLLTSGFDGDDNTANDENAVKMKMQAKIFVENVIYESLLHQVKERRLNTAKSYVEKVLFDSVKKISAVGSK